MVLLIIPAFEGLKKEWSESAQSLGASTFQYWLRIGLPVLAPSLIAGLTLLLPMRLGLMPPLTPWLNPNFLW